MEILNAYLMKKTPTVTWREELFHFSVFPLYDCFLSPVFPFTLSPILSLKKEEKTVPGETNRSNIFSHFWLRN